jgi:hypothetical protein
LRWSQSPAAPHSLAAPGQLPPLMLWAWERPTDLRGLSSGIGVAFLSQTIHLQSGAIGISPRRQKLVVSPGTRLVAVTRIEATPAALSDLDGGELSSRMCCSDRPDLPLQLSLRPSIVRQ